MFGAAIKNKVGRTKLGGESVGTDKLFGTDGTTYEKSSSNPMITKTSSQKLLQTQVSAKEQVAKELYGATALKYGIKNNKRDGALMAQNVDWKNANVRAIQNDKAQLVSSNLDSKDRKY